MLNLVVTVVSKYRGGPIDVVVDGVVVTEDYGGPEVGGRRGDGYLLLLWCLGWGGVAQRDGCWIHVLALC